MLHPSRLRVAATALVLGGLLTPRIAVAQRTVTSAARAAVVARIDSLAEAFVRDGRAPGVSVAVVRAGRDTIVMKGYGLADVENDVPATARTVYEIGSVTKQFTSSLIMRLVERGELSLDDSLGALLPGMPEAWQGVRLRQLLNHTSGIRSYTSLGPRWAPRTRAR